MIAQDYNQTDFIDNFTNTTSVSPRILYGAEIRPLVGIWLLIVSLFGTPANFLVLCCAWKLFRKMPRNIANSNNVFHQYFVISMTVADLAFVSIYACVMSIQYFSLNISLNVYECGFVYFICHASTVCSSLSLLCLNIDKFIAVIRPLHHNSIVTKSRVLILISICWLISIIWALFFVFTMISTSPGNCGMVLASFETYCIFTVTFFILPTLLSVILSIIVGIVAYTQSSLKFESPVRNSKFEFPARKNGSVSGVKFVWDTKTGSEYRKISKRSSSSIGSMRDEKLSRYRSVINRFRTLIFVFATTMWSFLTCLPYRIMYLFYISASEEQRIRHLTLAYVMFAMMASNPLGNPIVTFLTQRRYRRVICDLCINVCSRFGFGIRGRNFRSGRDSMMSRFGGTLASFEEIEVDAMAGSSKKNSRNERIF